MLYGYIRVSTKFQHTDRQEQSLKDYNIPKENIFCDRQSGKDFTRPAYQKLIKKLKKGDLLVIKSIDRLGRNYEEILEQWRIITKVIQSDIVVIDMPLLDTRTQKDITGLVLSDIVLQLISYFAHIERDYIRQRQLEGIREAKARGVKFGRPKTTKPKNYKEIYSLWLKKKISAREAGRRLNVDHKTFIKWASMDNK